MERSASSPSASSTASSGRSTPGELRVEVPAGLLQVSYVSEGNRVASVRIRNVASYLVASDVQVELPDFGSLRVDVAYGGNYYAIVEPQGPYVGLDALGASRLIELSVQVRARVREQIQPVHPLEPSIRGVSHVLWADRPKSPGADARNAVFYGERAIDRSPCGTGTSARMAQLAAQGKLRPGDRFVHESYIGSRFIGRVEEQVQLAGQPAIVAVHRRLGARHRHEYALDRRCRSVLARFSSNLSAPGNSKVGS